MFSKLLFSFFQGIGIAILTSQAFLGIYSIIGVSWMLVYFRDSFITKQDVYRWAEPFGLYREGKLCTVISFIIVGFKNNNKIHYLPS